MGDAAVKVRPELALRFKLPALNTPISTLVHSVRAMIGVAETEREVLAGVGLSEAALAALMGEVAELEETIKTSGTARAEHVGASSSLAEVTREVLNLVGSSTGSTATLPPDPGAAGRVGARHPRPGRPSAPPG